MTHSLDLSALKKLKAMIGGDPKDLAELVDDFVAALPDQRVQMNEQSAVADWSALRITAHSCKSNSRDLGALHLSQLCAQLETECAAGEVQELDVQLSQISVAVDAALETFAKLDLADV